MRILLFGTTGQVGWELQRALQPLGEITAVSRSDASFEEPDALRRAFASRPDVVVNAVAYTAVDQAESEPEKAMRINADAVAALADESRRSGALFVHFSTDYVFDGAQSAPYSELDAPNPLGAYARSKRAGEQHVIASGCDYLILRTSWVFSPRGKNFVKTVLGLAAARDELRIVADQTGAPTGADLIADVTAHVIRMAQVQRAATGFSPALLHLTAAGATTWFGLASRVVERASALGAFGTRAIRVVPISTGDYPLPASRPANSLLDGTRLRDRYGIIMPPWTTGVDRCVEELAAR